MGLDHLLASLERNATADATALVAEARARAARVSGDAADRIAQRRTAALAAREEALRVTAELAVARTRRAARVRVLDARARAIERVFAAVGERLPAAAGTAPYLATLPARLAAARACIGDAPAVARCAPALAPALSALVGGTGLSVVPDPAIATGFRLTTCDGSLEVHETLEAHFARRRQAVMVDVARALEEDGA